MTSSGKIRIYELSRDLGLDNKDVLDAAHKLSIAAKSHSSSISNEEAKLISAHLNNKKGGNSASKNKASAGKEILSLKKAVVIPNKETLLVILTISKKFCKPTRHMKL